MACGLVRRVGSRSNPVAQFHGYFTELRVEAA